MADIETKPTVTISLEEYKELVLKAEAIDKEDLIVQAIYNLILTSGKVVEPGSYEETACGISIEYTNKFAKDLIMILYTIDSTTLLGLPEAILEKKKALDLLKKLLGKLEKKDEADTEEEKEEDAE